MKKAGMTLLMLAILLLGWHYYSENQKSNSVYTAENSSRKNESLPEPSQALQEYVIGNNEDPKGLRAQLESEKKTESALKNQASQENQENQDNQENQENQDSQDNQDNQDNQENQQNNENQKEQEVQILQKYREQFLALQNEYMGKINALIGEAEAEYKASPKAKRRETSLSLGLKYLNKGSALESECDARFYAILGQMQSELEANEIATTGVQAAELEYEGQKNSRREMFLGKAMNQ